ncbi:MAG: pitrilysin family protein [Christensenellaceae bacterium]
MEKTMYIKEKLECGVTLIAEKLENFHSTTIGIWVGAGSITENKNENGLSHLIEHMLFKGTTKRSAKQVSVDVDNIGGQINAFTSKEATCYYIKMIDEKLEEGIEILTDVFCNATLDSAELEKEKGVVLEEIAMSNDNPEDLAMDLISSSYFKGCSLEKTILGPAQNIKGFMREDLVAYMDKYYTAENIVIAVAGNFKTKELIDYLNQYLSNINRKPLIVPQFADCSSFVPSAAFDTAIKDIEQVHICMAMPSYSLKDPSRYAMNILNNVIGGSMSSRLFQKIREEMGMAYSVASFPSLFRNTGMFTIYAGTMSQNTNIVTEMILEELELIKKSGITQEEFLQSKEQLRGNFILSLESTSAKMNAIGKTMMLTGTVSSDEEVLKKFSEVTYDEIRSTIDYMIKPELITATYVGKIDDKEKLKKILA